MARKTQGLAFAKFCAEFGKHPDGPLIGQPFVLHEFWVKVFCELLEWVQDEPGGPWRRRYNEAYISVPKKNSKTSCLAHLALFLLLNDIDPNTGQVNPSPHIVSAAASEDQGANLLYGSVKTIIELSPQLQPLLEVLDKEVTVRGLARARLRNLTSKAATNDGLHCSGALLDELHQWPGQRGRDMFSILSGAISGRPNGLLISITTAGWDESSICYDRYAYGKKVESGEIEDDSFYFKCLEAPEDADYRDPKVWASVNPLLGLAVQPQYLAARCRRELESTVRRFHLNTWTASEQSWISGSEWDKLADLTGAFQLDPSKPVWCGIDISQSIDSSAVALVQKFGTADEPIYSTHAKVWSNPYRLEDPLYKSFRINHFEIMEYLRQLFTAYPVPACTIDRQVKPGPCLPFDPWRFRSEATTLLGEGLSMVEFAQNDAKMVPASQALFEAIKAGTLRHDGDPILRTHVLAATAEQKSRGWRLSKPAGSVRKIDACIALSIALWCCQSMPAPTFTSVYEPGGRGLLII